MLKNYFKTAWRNMMKNKTTSIINILGLTLGITACLIIYLDTSFELSYDNFHPDKERIYRVVTSAKNNSGETDYKPTVPDPMAATIRTEFTGIEKVAQFHDYYAKVTVPAGGNETKTFDAPNEREEETSDIIISDPEYFDIFKYEWIAGNATSMREPFHVVLTENKAKKYFGSLSADEIIGKKIIYNDSLTLSVSGVVKNYPNSSDFIFNDFISSATIQRSFVKDNFDFTNWERWNRISQTFVKVAKGATPLQFQKQTLELVKKNMDVGNDTRISISLQPLSDIHFNANYQAAYGREVHVTILYGLMVIAIFILLIAAVNFINLSTAQSLQRAKEIGVRKVLGSSTNSLIFQFLCETFILTALSVIISLIIVSPIITAFHAFLPDGVGLSFNQNSIIFILLITLGISLLAGFYPAKVLSSYLPVLTLKGAAFQQGSGKNYLRKGLIVFQFTISLIFIIGTLIIGNQIKYVLNTDMGFAKDAIINITGNQNYPGEKMQILAQQIKRLAGVQMVSVDLGTPAEESHWSTILKSKELGDAAVGAEFQAGDENYIKLYQLKLLTGRNLLPGDTMKEYLVNESLAKQLGFKKPEDAIGKTISSGGDDGTASHKMLPIVGVLADFHSGSLHDVIAPTFVSTSKKYSRIISVKLATAGKQSSDFKATTAKIEKLWKDVYPDEKFEYKFFDETIAKFYDKEQGTEQLMNTAMAITIFISCMGLFGLVTFETQKRTKEIGIRKVLGASVSNIVSMFSMNFLKLILLAFVIASPVSYYFMHQWLQNFAYRIDISWWVFVLSVLAAMFIALITISFQAIKAAMANPVKSLRTE
jgi:putative ABC transport system permease protein